MTPRLVRPNRILGPLLTARIAVPDDAEFILSLRLDPGKGAHVSPTDPDLAGQREWLSNYAGIYLIFEATGPVGCARLYDPVGVTHTWGSWFLTYDRPSGSALESALMVYALSSELGFSAAHFSVNQPNTQCWRFLESLGAERIGETSTEFQYVQHEGVTREMLQRHQKTFHYDW